MDLSQAGPASNKKEEEEKKKKKKRNRRLKLEKITSLPPCTVNVHLGANNPYICKIREKYMYMSFFFPNKCLFE